MAKKFKDYYDISYARMISDKISRLQPDFDVPFFMSHIDEALEELSFLQRQDYFVAIFEKTLGKDYLKNLELFYDLLGPELQTETGMFTEGWWLWPIGRYIECHALEAPEETMAFIKELTKRHTGEFAVRPLMMTHTRSTMETLYKWSKDESVHVRRCASEGLRPLLPWAKKTRAALNEADLYMSILSALKDDPSKFVQKSVGNNINDLYKVDALLAQKIVDVWEAHPQSKPTQWIIKHGKRRLPVEKK